MFLFPSETDTALGTDAAVPPSPPPDAAEEAAAGRGPAARAGAARQVRRVLDVSGELAQRRVAPRDAAHLQATEQSVLDGTQRGGPAAVVQSAATVNAREPRGQGPNHGPRRRSGHGRDGRGQGGRQSNAAAIQVCFCLFCCVSRSISPMLLTYSLFAWS